MIIEGFPVDDLLPGMSVVTGTGTRKRIKDVWDHRRVSTFGEFGRAAVGTRWVVFEGGGCSVMDVGDVVKAQV